MKQEQDATKRSSVCVWGEALGNFKYANREKIKLKTKKDILLIIYR